MIESAHRRARRSEEMARPDSAVAVAQLATDAQSLAV